MADEVDRRIIHDTIKQDVRESVVYASVELEMAERLKQLHELGIGRAFVHKTPKRENLASKTIYLAYSLPLDRMLSRHIVIFNDGSLMLTEAADGLSQARYSHELGPNPSAMNLVSDEISQTQRFFLHGTSEIKSRGIKSSIMQDDLPELIEYLKQGLELGNQLKAEREMGESGSQVVVELLGSFVELQLAPQADERRDFDQ